MPVTSIYTLSSPNSPGSSPEVFGQGQGINENPDILGYGLMAPFIRSNADFYNDGSFEHLDSMISQVLGVMGGNDYIEGELPWRNDFGSQLHLLRHKNNTDVVQELARIYIIEALSKWLPQIIVEDIIMNKKTDYKGDENILEIRIGYSLNGSVQGSNSSISRSTFYSYKY